MLLHNADSRVSGAFFRLMLIGMRMVILGASTPLGGALVTACAGGGDQAVALVRAPQHVERLRASGAEPVLVGPDESPHAVRAALTGALHRAEALVLAAGTGGAAGRGPAALFAAAGERAGVRRYLMVSNWHGAEDRTWSGEEKAAYLAAKRAAEDDLRARDLDWTILRTGRLTDGPAGGGVRLRTAPDGVAPAGAIGRADVAAAVLALLRRSAACGLALELTSGKESLEETVRNVFGPADT